MSRWIRKTAAVLAAVLLLAGMLSAFGKQPDEKEVLLQENWAACLETYEQLYGTMLWAFDYAEAFVRDNTWESLQKARAACCSAILALEKLEMPENTMTLEQMQALMDKGVEADVVATEITSLPTLRIYKIQTMTLLLYLLRDDVYLAPSAEKIGSWIKSNRDNVSWQCEYLGVTTNYLLLQMEDQSFWQTLPERFPTIGESCREWSTDPVLLQAEADRILDNMAGQLSAESEYLGISEYTLKVVQEAVRTGDLQILAKELHRIDGVPGYFPLPSWLPQELIWYYLIEDQQTEELRLLQAGETMETAPSACYIPCDGITMEDMGSYEEQLRYWGMDYYGSHDETGAYDILVSAGDSRLLVKWTEEETLLYLTEPIGCLMPELYLGAMVLE